MQYLESNKYYAIDLLCKLIEIPTVNPPGENYEDMVCVLEKECKKLGLTTRVYATPQNILNKYGIKSGSKRVSLIGEWDVSKARALHINCHYDVVPATDKWNTDPFKAVLKKGKIYGRGSEDMKGNIASILYALNSLKECGISPTVNIQLSFTPDEEIGGRTGLGYLIQKNFVRADYAMGEGYARNYISMGNKGVLWAEITIGGKSCHASIPHKGVNAFERMLVLGRALENLKKRIIKRKTKYPMRDTISRSPTFVIGGLLEGGVKVNVVPGMAKFSIDRRLIPEESIDVAKKEIEEIIKKFNSSYRDSKAHIKFTSQERPAISKIDKKFFSVVSDAIKSVTGKKAKFCLMTGATDMRYFIWKGVPAIGYTVRGGESWHSDNEFVYVDGLIEAAKVYLHIITHLE